MLHRFSAKRYRHLDADDLELGRLNLLIGPNNAGKSTFIKTIRFAADVLVPREGSSAFLAALDAQGRGELLDRQCQPPGEIELAWTLSSTPEAKKLTYELGFKVARSEDFPGGFYITKERLAYAEPAEGHNKPFWFFDRNRKDPERVSFSVKDAARSPKTLELEVSSRDTVLQQHEELLRHPNFYADFYPTFDRVTRDVRDYFKGFREYASAEIYPDAVIEGSSRDISVTMLDRRGVQLANVLRHVDEAVGLGEYNRHLAQLMADLREVKVVSVGDTKHSLRLDFLDGRRFKLGEMSHGTIKAMILAHLVTSPVQMRLLSLDEPELNLHPAWLRVLGRWLLECKSADQIFISTHSPDLLDVFTEAFREREVALFVFNWPRRGVQRVEPQELDTFFQEGWELGDLYRVGEPKLGGWPA
ncbi:AAA family ATPase [Polyangium spumosum]|nr:AAA family ATPase [Polyangium spumosum]